jgi:KipI family sensor histidine kinase inhibitor
MPVAPPPSEPRVSLAGTAALLFDPAGARYDDAVQFRIWALARRAAALAGVGEAVPGMNNLMLVFDPLRLAADDLAGRLRALWADLPAEDPGGRTIEIPVRYDGPDLADLAGHAGLAVDAYVARHAGADYRVAALGAMPGFPYLSGLDPRLARPRRAVPRAAAPAGAVMIGGTQAGLMPVTAPTGWHILGHTDRVLFDAARPEPCLLRPGDHVRFVVREVAP